MIKAITDLLTELWNTGDVVKVAQGVLAAEFIWGEDLNLVEVGRRFESR